MPVAHAAGVRHAQSDAFLIPRFEIPGKNFQTVEKTTVLNRDQPI